jgi:hypothetical protein
MVGHLRAKKLSNKGFRDICPSVMLQLGEQAVKL